MATSKIDNKECDLDTLSRAGKDQLQGMQFAYVELPRLQAQASDDLYGLDGEAMGWKPLEGGAYVHQGGPSDPKEEQVVYVVDVPDTVFAGLNVLLLT
jgi:hypothetical protein